MPVSNQQANKVVIRKISTKSANSQNPLIPSSIGLRVENGRGTCKIFTFGCSNLWSLGLSNFIEMFLKTLKEHQKGFRILVRWSKGEDIEAACGQLAVSNQWKK